MDVKIQAPRYAFLLMWFVMWTVGGGEIIMASAVSMSQRIEAFGIGISRSYTLSECRDLRAAPHINDLAARRQALFPWSAGTGFGSVALDYGARTVRFAPDLDEAEAKMLVADLSRWLKVPAA